MRSGQFAACLAALLVASCSPEPEPPVAGPAPEVIFHGGVVHTGVEGASDAQAVSVSGGRIVAVGTSSELLALAGAETEQIDLLGAHLYPGFTDAHVHLRGVGEREMTLDLDEVTSLAGLVEAVRVAAAGLPPGQVLTGRGWIETHWPEGRFPTRQDLDAVSGDHPVVLTRADGHALVANTLALRKAGLAGKPKSQPDGGRIEVDAEGLPTGMLIDNAMAAMAKLEVRPTAAQVEEAYIKGGARELSVGWTGVHNMSVPAADVAVMNRLSDAGSLKLRIYNAVDSGDVKPAAEDAPFDPKVFGMSGNGLVVTRAIKLYMDGALGSRGALLSAPYSDRPDTTGLQLATEEATLALMRRALKGGVQICMHAIGDRGNGLVLDWMEKAFATAPPADGRDPRWRIEHSQILHVSDIPRFAALGVIASMQPSHAIGDLFFAPARLGEDRLAGAYAWRSLIDAGAVIAGGSDAPVEQGDPRIEFYAAVARKDLKGQSGPDWSPEQAVTRAEALKMFTLWPAYASFREADLGTVEPGKLADFTVLSKDILTVPEAEILTAEPVMTIVNGEVAWRRP